MHDGCVTPRHFGVQPPYAPSGGAQPHAQFRFFARAQIRPKAAHPLEGVNAHQRVAPAGMGLSHKAAALSIQPATISQSPSTNCT